MTYVSRRRELAVYSIIVAALVLLFVLGQYTWIASEARIGVTVTVGLGLPTLLVSYLNYTS